MAFEDEKLNLFESTAKSQGFSEEEIAPFLEFGRIKAQEADEPIDLSKDPVFQRQVEFAKLTGTISDTPGGGLTGQAAFSEVVRQGGRNLLKGKTISERESEAEVILSFGGVSSFRQQAPLRDLLSVKQLEKDQQSTDLLSDVQVLQQLFPVGTKADFFRQGNLTGPIASKLGFLRSQDQQTAQALIAELSTEKIKILSGVAVSPKEFERLRKFLPDARDQENEVATKLDALDRAIRMNQAIREEALRTGKTVSEVFRMDSKRFFREFGFDPNNPSKDLKEGLPATPPQSLAPEIDDIDTFLNSF